MAFSLSSFFGALHAPSTSTWMVIILDHLTRFSSIMMLITALINQVVPHKYQTLVMDYVTKFLPKNRKKATIVIDERDASMANNEVYDAAEVYLCSKLGKDMEHFKITKKSKDPKVTVKLAKFRRITDVFKGVEIKWRYVLDDTKKRHVSETIDDEYTSTEYEKQYLELTFDKNHTKLIMDEYVPFVLQEANSLRTKEKVIKLHTLNTSGSLYGSSTKTKWDWINLEHPSTFDTLAMEAEKKKAIKDDLDRFVSRKDFYRKVGKAWKRGYLLYGPPGTGKSSLIAAMANYLKFDIYDLELTNVKQDSDLRKLLLGTGNKSILVIEDIDCSAPLPDRKKPVKSSKNKSKNRMQLFSLSGLLNFVDGLWSSCGDERIIIFTTNHKERLEPALLRPGRMDMHIHMSYLTIEGFKLLASTYLNVIDSHPLYPEIEELLDGMRVTPAEVAEEFMHSDDADVCLDGLVNFLKCKKDSESTKIIEDEVSYDEDSTEDEDSDSMEKENNNILKKEEVNDEQKEEFDETTDITDDKQQKEESDEIDIEQKQQSDDLSVVETSLKEGVIYDEGPMTDGQLKFFC